MILSPRGASSSTSQRTQNQTSSFVDLYPQFMSPASQSRVPPEIWRTIHRHSTQIPCDLATDDSLLFTPWSSGSSVSSYARLMTTRRTLLLVCRSWYLIACELMYESIRVSALRKLESLAHALETTPRRYEHERPPGWWVKRLEVDGNIEAAEDASFEEIMCRILHHMPNLAVFAIRWTRLHSSGHMPPTQPAVLHTLIRVAGRTLRRIEWPHMAGPSVGDLSLVFECCPNLQTVDLKWVFPDPDPGADEDEERQSEAEEEAIEEPSPHGALLHLTTLNLCPSPHWDLHLPYLTHHSLPALRTLRIDTKKIPLDPIMRPFLDAHGRNLHNLFLPSSLTRSTHADLVRQACPNLLTLVFSVRSDFFLTSHRTVRNIGLTDFKRVFYPLHSDPERNRREEAQMKREDLAGFASRFEALIPAGSWPKLEVVRFVECERAALLEGGDEWILQWWTGWIRRWRERGVRLEDGEGKVICLPTAVGVGGVNIGGEEVGTSVRHYAT